MTLDSREDLAERPKPPLSAWPKEENQFRLMFNDPRADKLHVRDSQFVGRFTSPSKIHIIGEPH